MDLFLGEYQCSNVNLSENLKNRPKRPWPYFWSYYLSSVLITSPLRGEGEGEDVAAGAAASAITAQPATATTGTGINSAKKTDAIKDVITMAVCTTPIHTMTTMITTKPPVTITVEIAVMTITTIDVIVTNSNMQLEDQRVLL
jgi:hypothetical protein